jgi:hypothetical protein
MRLKKRSIKKYIKNNSIQSVKLMNQVMRLIEIKLKNDQI